MHRSRKSVVGGLSVVDVVVGVNRVFGTDGFAGDLAASVGDHLVGVHVRGGARAGLKNVHRKVFVVFALGHLLRRLGDQGRDRRFDRTELLVRFGGGGLEVTESVNHLRGDRTMGDGKVADCPLGRGAVERFGRHGHRSHRVGFFSCFAWSHGWCNTL